MKNKIIKNTKLLLAPLMMLAYQLTKKQSFLECCLKWDRTYHQALKQNAIINGSEVSVLKDLDLEQWQVALFSIEHSYGFEKIKEILSLCRYKRILEIIFDYDYLYAHPTLHRSLKSKP